MKYFLFLLPILFFSCKEKSSELTLSDIRTSSQFFDIKSDTDTLIEGNKGTRIKFQKNSFITADGQEIKGDVHIQLTEFYSTEDFISNRLSTNTIDGQILKSSGMVFIEATSNGEILKLKDSHPMTIMFKRLQDSSTANLFSGEKGSKNEIRWRTLPPVYNDTIIIRTETIRQISYGVDEVTVDLKFLIGKDTIELTDANERQFEKVLTRYKAANKFEYVLDSTQTNSLRPKYSSDLERLYVFETTSLGYLNCDIIIDKESYISIAVKSNDSDTDMFIVLDNLKSVVYPDSGVYDKASVGYFTIPKGQAISIVGYNKSGQTHSYSINKLTANTDIVSIDLKQESLEKIREEIKKLE